MTVFFTPVARLWIRLLVLGDFIYRSCMGIIAVDIRTPGEGVCGSF